MLPLDIYKFCKLFLHFINVRYWSTTCRRHGRNLHRQCEFQGMGEGGTGAGLGRPPGEAWDIQRAAQAPLGPPINSSPGPGSEPRPRARPSDCWPCSYYNALHSDVIQQGRRRKVGLTQQGLCNCIASGIWHRLPQFRRSWI
jgi:hypothetical protein